MSPDEIFAALKARFPQVERQEQTGAAILPREALADVAAFLKGSDTLCFDNLHCITAVDRNERLELVHIFSSVRRQHKFTLKSFLDRARPEIESLCGLYKSADWFEREVYDLFGVVFLNRSGLRRILNPDDWQGHPLRKDYEHPNIVRKAD